MAISPRAIRGIEQRPDVAFFTSSFPFQYNLDEGKSRIGDCSRPQEFFIFRGAVSESVVQSLYEEALFAWPPADYAKSNLPNPISDAKTWLRGFVEPWKYRFLDQLRWVTLGYHYDWAKKVYPDNCCGSFPTKLAVFYKSVALTVAEEIRHEDGLLTHPSCYTTFTPEASIVNYYRKKTTMGFHIDDTEVSKLAPLISVSLGRPAIYLLEASGYIPGSLPHGNSEEVTRTIIPILLRHGDIMVSGGHSRLAFHAVPRLLSWERASLDLPTSFFPNLLSKFLEMLGDACEPSSLRDNLESYIYSTRLNMNVRQVNEHSVVQ
ncbi:unnamed protein product [Mesocestoides corti]|uniref:Fe2OG dioxygenase domain-containing protein n=1 Tax=Mesocestoides corti TaxID=53468 RepID=A0A0R3UL31_MESCO|nr:unnamed protein product [Mesocestoides corti]